MLPIGRGSHLMSDSIQVEHLDVVKFDYRIVRLFCFTCGVSALFLEQKSQFRFELNDNHFLSL